MILRLILFEKCNRSCEGCCNKDFDIPNLSIARPVDMPKYESILLTGGEPMLNPQLVIDTVYQIRLWTQVPIYMYTAKSKRALDLIAMLNILDGITLTLHEPYDLTPFKELNDLLLGMNLKGKSLRLNVFKPIDVSGINLRLWKVKNNIEWIKNCPLPKNEELKRL